VNVTSAVNANDFTLSMVGQEVKRRMQLPADWTLVLDDSMHSYATLPTSLRDNQDAWYFIEEMKPRVAASAPEL
jgi:hypothetical protein